MPAPERHYDQGPEDRGLEKLTLSLLQKADAALRRPGGVDAATATCARNGAGRGGSGDRLLPGSGAEHVFPAVPVHTSLRLPHAGRPPALLRTAFAGGVPGDGA